MGVMARRRDKINACSLQVRKPDRGGHWLMWQNNINLCLRQTGWEDMEWLNLAQDRNKDSAAANFKMNLRVY